MSVLSKEDFFKKLEVLVGDDTSDETITLLEDMKDTFNDFETKSGGNNDAEWEEKYKNLDAEWRERYKKRFFNSETTDEEIIKDNEKDIEDDSEVKSYDDLFEERED